ncbi:hypothetical protein BN946_scf184938.g9 [Trametes cinnabarina]|uniref:Uncharacterized protein n=1 Tax=Pycnoporus cinnabarinus TaxID=5643 RepID=A0A060S1B8_PYCCI|nr:hypothetical protein BN946_scf184938.g9 [Trametes cinnabarina]
MPATACAPPCAIPRPRLATLPFPAWSTGRRHSPSPVAERQRPAIALPRLAPSPRVRLQTYNPYAPIFPRLGDISALRDPYCDWYDRAYINFPTYSIHKILYLHDMLDRARPSTHPPPHLVQDAPLPDSPASTYSTDPLEPLLLGESHAGSPRESDARPWELHWRARWQVLVHRQPYAPHQLSSSSYDHSPPHNHSAPHPSPQEPVHAWSSPSPVSPVFGPAAHQPLSHAPAEADDDRRVYVWEESDAVPELVPLDSPLTRAELEFGAASVADVGVFPASGRPFLLAGDALYALYH